MNPLIQLKKTAPLFVIALLLTWFALLPTAQAVSPPPDGGYPNQNTAEGDNALFSLTTGDFNTATGFQALFNETSGRLNTANGARALENNTTGSENTATGAFALVIPTIGSGNTATGAFALYQTTGGQNTATGDQALNGNTTGSFNTATGGATMGANTTGSSNTATGAGALFHNTTGSFNTANGIYALSGNGTNNFNSGNNNTANGYQALLSNTTGNNNTAEGTKAMFRNTTGNKNTASGLVALFANTTGVENTASGNAALRANTTGSFNIALGSNAGANLTTGSNNIDIGAVGVAGESNTLRIGTVRQSATYIRGISGAIVGSGATVIVGTDGHLGTVVSSKRFKAEVKPMDRTSEAILALKPVTFRYKKELDPDGTPQFGLVAEDVEKVNPDLVVRDENDEIYTVRYDAVNAMLLNEFLKEHRTVQELKQEIAALAATVKEQAAQIQKVSAQLDLSKTAPQIVLNNQ